MYKRCYYLLVLLFLFPMSLQAQDADSEAKDDYQAERNVIESALGTMVKVIKTATFRENSESVQSQLHLLATRLDDVNKALPSTSLAAAAAEARADRSQTVQISLSDLQTLELSLKQISEQIRDLRQTLQAENDYDLAEKLAPVETGIDDAVVQTRRMIIAEQNAADLTLADQTTTREEAQERPRRKSNDPWLPPGEYEGGEKTDEDFSSDDPMYDVRMGIDEARSAVDEAREAKRTQRYTYHRYRNRSPFDDYDEFEAYVGEFYNRWPYRETALYRPIPAIRYNRVEGLVLGLRTMPLEWGDWENAKIYGQAGYAFAAKKLRYEVGAEFRPFPYGDEDFDFKIGVSYRDNTGTNDIWKANWVENSLAAMFFEYDFFDYYNVEGISAHAIQRLSPYAQLSVGFRSEKYTNLPSETTWSMFGTRDFRINPSIAEGTMNSVVAVLEGGRLYNLYSVPRGMAFRFEGEMGEGLGGDFDFSRAVGDIRFYVPFGYSSSLGFRVRGGYATDNAPIQKMFTLGGVGSMRAYPQNAFLGSKMLLANVEYTIANISPLDEVFDDVQLFGFGDAGWVNNFGSDEIDWDDVLPAAGFGLSFADRSLRLELAWPLKEINGNRDPSLWLRITPTF